MAVDTHKLNNLILHLGASPHVSNLGKTKLWKLIYFIDAEFLREIGRSLTKSEYIKYDHGPVPSRGERNLKVLSRDGAIHVKPVDYGSYQQHHITTIEDIEVGFTKEEKVIIDRICRKYGRSTATHLSEISHLEPSWANATNMDKINPELMFYGYEEDQEGL